jgi:hypothetical protein
MAERIVLVDDFALDHGDSTVMADTTVSLGFDGSWVELDLSADHFTELEKIVKPWMTAGHTPRRPVTEKPVQSRSPGEPGYRKWAKGFREWADSHGRSYITESGNYSYKVDDISDYQKYLSAQKQA